MTSPILQPPLHGIHAWLPSVARKCRNHGWTAEDTVHHLALLPYRRTVPIPEIRSAVHLIFRTQTDHLEVAPTKQPITWHSVATRRIHDELQISEKDLIEMSDVHPKDIDQRALLAYLFPDTTRFVCIGRNQYDFRTANWREQRNLAACQFIVPCYMTQRTGITKSGKISSRALSNTGPRRYIVFDFDDPPMEQQPSIIYWLMKYRSPILVIKSGGKSLHAWYRVESEKRDADFWKLGIMAGADKAILRNSGQSVRLPMGTRRNGQAQSVLYFNPQSTAP